MHQEKDDALSNNGLDAAICIFDTDQKILSFSGARLPIYYNIGSKIKHIKGDRQSIGYKKSLNNMKFTTHFIPFYKGMNLYLFTDGYIDQPGGKLGIGYGYKQLEQNLSHACTYPISKQKQLITTNFEAYTQAYETRDDCTFIGLNFNNFLP